MSQQFFDTTGQIITLGERLGQGGEGAVFQVPSNSRLVAKIYHTPVSSQKAEKIRGMVQMKTGPLLKVASWPSDLLSTKPGGGPLAGFLMPNVHGYRGIHTLYGPAHRKQEFPKADWQFLIHTARNLASVFLTVHDHGQVVIGDVNESNIVVSADAFVNLIDCDSFQVPIQGKLHLCEVGKPEFTPPELQGRSFQGVQRMVNHDYFGLAILIFQLLFMGRHPFAGRYKGSGDMPIAKAIQEYRFAYGSLATSRLMEPPPKILPFSSIPSDLVKLFERAFSEDGTRLNRPDPKQWMVTLQFLETNLVKCKRNTIHSYYKSLSKCPWCELEQSHGVYFFVAVHTTGTTNQDRFDLYAVWAQIEAVPSPAMVVPPNPLQLKVSPTPLSPELLAAQRRNHEVEKQVTLLKKKKKDLAMAIKKQAILLAEQNHEIEKLVTLMTETTHEIAKQATLVVEKNHEIAKLATLVAEQDHNQEIAKQVILVAEKNQKIVKLETLVAEKNQEIAKLMTLVAEKNQEIAKLMTLVTEKNQEVTKLVALVAKENQEMAKLATLVTVKNQEIAKLETLVAEKNQEIAKRATLVAEKNQEIVNLATSEFRGFIRGFFYTIKNWVNIKKLKAKRQLLETTLSELKKELQGKETTLSELRREQQQREITLSELKNEQQRRETTLSELKLELKNEQQRCETTLSELKKELQGNETTLSDLRKERQQHKTILSELKNEQQKIEEALAELRNEQQRRETTLSKLKNEQQGRENALAELQKEQQRCETRLAEMRNEQQRCETKLSKFNNKQQELETTLAKLKKEQQGCQYLLNTEQQKRELAFRKTEQQWTELIECWPEKTSNQSFLDKFEQLKQKFIEYQNLNLEYTETMKQLDSQRYQNQLTHFLESHFIDKANIPGIGNKRALILESYGIETAADVTYEAVIAVPGFGETMTNDLVKWRKQIEKQFKFNPNEVLSPADLKILQSLDKKRLALQQTLLNGAEELERIRLSILERQSGLKNKADKLALELAQARADVSVFQ